MKAKKKPLFLVALVLLLMSMSAVLTSPVSVALGFTRAMMLVKGMTHHVESNGDFEVSFFEKNEEKQQTVILVHGLSDQAGTWWQTLEVLEDYHVIAVELPGHGESGPPSGDIDVAMFRKAIGFVMKRSHGPAILIGNSLGGYVSLDYGLKNPERVARIVAIDAAGMPMEINADVFMPVDRAGMAETMFKVTGPNEPTIPGFILDDIRDSLLAGATPRVWKAIRDGGPLDQELPFLTVPTDVIWGDQDGLIPVEQGRAMAKLIPGASYAEISGCGHSPQATCSEELNPILSRILSGTH